MSDAVPQALEVQVNGEAQRLEAGATIAQLVEALGLGDRRVAVAVNREVVPRSRFPEWTLTTGDNVEILQAVGGGI